MKCPRAQKKGGLGGSMADSDKCWDADHEVNKCKLQAEALAGSLQRTSLKLTNAVDVGQVLVLQSK